MTLFEMKLNKDEFLDRLEMLESGLSNRETVEQSSCIVFQGRWMMTFNDEVACRIKSGIEMTGAVKADALLKILRKIKDPEISIHDDNPGEMQFRMKGKRFALIKEQQIFLPIDQVEMPGKDDWYELSQEFTEAVAMVRECVSDNDNFFALSCVHFHPDWIEGCDNFQVMRVRIKTGFQNSVLVRGSSLRHITSLGMDQFSMTKSWIHFKNQAGLILSCRRYKDDYLDTSSRLETKGHKIILPKGMAEACDRCGIFAEDIAGAPYVTVKVRKDLVKIRGEGLNGWNEEIKGTEYDGPPMEFQISPGLLKQVSEQYNEAEISKTLLQVKGKKWHYVTVLGLPKAEDEEETESE